MAEGSASSVSNIFVLAGCNGAGKSSVGGAALLHAGATWFDPDAAARRIAIANHDRSPEMSAELINAAAWNEGRRLLERAIESRFDYAFETTLGGHTMTGLLERAARAGIAVSIWFVGLATVEMHLARIRRRVAEGGHDIPEAIVRRRHVRGRENLIRLLPHLAALRVIDNSIDADATRGKPPAPRLVIDVRAGRIVAPRQLESLLLDTPKWAKPVVAKAMKLHLRRR